MALTNKTPSTKVQHVFDNIADHYDSMNNVISLGLHNHWRQQVDANLALQKGDQVLDLCCGTGVWTFILADLVGPTGNVVGLDFSTGMLEVAEHKQAQENIKNIQFLQGDAQELPFAANTFDKVTIGFGLRNVPDASRVLEEMYRVVKPGGQVVCLETSQPQQPVIRLGWELYFGKLLPLVGGLIHRYDEYNYLQSSTHKFVSPEILEALFIQAGFKAVHYDTFVAGAAAAHYGQKS